MNSMRIWTENYEGTDAIFDFLKSYGALMAAPLASARSTHIIFTGFCQRRHGQRMVADKGRADALGGSRAKSVKVKMLQ